LEINFKKYKLGIIKLATGPTKKLRNKVDYILKNKLETNLKLIRLHKLSGKHKIICISNTQIKPDRNT